MIGIVDASISYVKTKYISTAYVLSGMLRVSGIEHLVIDTNPIMAGQFEKQNPGFAVSGSGEYLSFHQHFRGDLRELLAYQFSWFLKTVFEPVIYDEFCLPSDETLSKLWSDYPCLRQ